MRVLGFYSSRAWPLFLIGIPLGRTLRDPFHIVVPLRFTKTWRASHSLIHANVVNKQSLTSAVSIYNAFSLHTISFRMPFSLHTVSLECPSALSFLRPVVPLLNILSCRQPFGTMTDGPLHSVTYHLWPISFILTSCPLLHISIVVFYTDGLWSIFPSVVMYFFLIRQDNYLCGIPRVAAHLMLWTRGEFLLAVLLTTRRFVFCALSFRI